MRKLADHGPDDHPAGGPDRRAMAWAVAVLDECEPCGEPRVELTVEEVGRTTTGLALHLSPVTARRLRAALREALRQIGEEPGA